MLQNLSERIRLCYERAAKARQQAEETNDPKAKADFLNTERRWLLLARSYQHSESLTDFVHAIPDRSNVAGTRVDSTKRPRSAQALRAPKDDLQKVLDRTPFMLTRCSSDLRYQFVSRAYAEMIGLQPGEIADKAIVEILGEERFNTILPHIQQVLRGDRVEFESQVPLRGGPRFLHVIYTPDIDKRGNVQGWIASIFDISDRAHAARDRERLASIVDFSHDAIISKDLNGVIVTWNKGAERIFGYSADEAVGKPITMLIPPDLQDEEPRILEHIRRGERIDSYETKRRHKNGRLLDISLTVSPVKDTDGRIVGASKIAQDITNQKRAQEIEETLIHEIQHRSNNQLAVIQAIAHQTLSGNPSLAEAKKVFDARLQALARANRQLNESSWSRVNLSEIVRSAMAPFGGRTTIDGVDLMVGAEHVQNFSLALHELATNAAKYGALSNENGKVEICWTVAEGGRDNRLKFIWEERGGPRVVAPTRRGFGTSLLKAAFTDVRIDYSVEGLVCEIDLVLGRAELGSSSSPGPPESDR
jgi:PAS domain S-box-containing protein